MSNIGHHICCAWSYTNQSHCFSQLQVWLTPVLGFCPSHLILVWIPSVSTLEAPPPPHPIPTQPSLIHIGSGERKDHSLQNFRGPEETNLLQDVGSLEFPLEERNNGGKGKGPRIRTSEWLLAPVLIYSVILNKSLRLWGLQLTHLHSKCIVLNNLSLLHSSVHPFNIYKVPNSALCRRHISIRATHTHTHTMAQNVIWATDKDTKCEGLQLFCCGSLSYFSVLTIRPDLSFISSSSLKCHGASSLWGSVVSSGKWSKWI